MKKIMIAGIIVFGFLILIVGYIFIGFYSTKGSNSIRPLLKEQYFFHHQGIKKEYFFKPKPFKSYTISIQSKKIIPYDAFKGLEVGGKIKWELFMGNSKISEGYLKFRNAARSYETFNESLKGTSNEYLLSEKGVDRFDFQPITRSMFGLFPMYSKLVLTVESADVILEKYSDDLTIFLQIDDYM